LLLPKGPQFDPPQLLLLFPNGPQLPELLNGFQWLFARAEDALTETAVTKIRFLIALFIIYSSFLKKLRVYYKK
jgi:hypothetical protein